MAELDRFAHLLQPIRDLSENWSIDISNELEEYLEVLEGLTFSFEGGPSLNFAEAALLIQGSACVYSKKVEYLHSLVYQALEFIAERKRKDQRGKEAGTRANAVEDDNEFDDEEQFLSLDDVLEEGAGIDLDDDEEPMIVAPTRLPATLLALETTDAQGGDAGASKYRIASCAVHHSGALLLEARDGDALDARLEPILIPKLAVITSNEGELNSDAHGGAPAAYNDGADFDDEDIGGGFDGGYYPDDDGGVEYMDGDQQPTEGVLEQRTEYQQGLLDVMQGGIEQEEEPELFDPYAPLDPNDRAAGKSKPFRRVKRMANKVRTKQQQQHLQAGGDVMNALLATQAPVAGVILPQFQSAWEALLRVKTKEGRKAAAAAAAEGRRGVAAQLASAFTAEEAAVNVATGLDDDFDDEPADFYGGGGYDDGDDFGAGGNDTDFGQDLTLALADPHSSWMGMGDPMATTAGNGSYNAADQEASADEMTYEELCRAHIEAFISAAAAAEVQTDLAARVTSWRSKMEPTLAEEDARPEFDIKAYGDRILDRMAALSCSDSADAGSENPTAASKNKKTKAKDGESEGFRVLGFGDVVSELENKYEVSRMFSSTLQLINSGNVHITKLGGGEFTLKLIKKQPEAATTTMTTEPKDTTKLASAAVVDFDDEDMEQELEALMPTTNKTALKSAADQPQKKGKAATKAAKRRKA